MSCAGDRHRRGVALVCALGLLALAAALLGAACLSSRAMAHRGRGARQSAIADALALRALAQVVSEWRAPADALAVGASLDYEVPSAVANATTWARITKVGARLDVVVVDVRAGAEPNAARRRMRVIVESGRTSDSAVQDAAPHRIARWSVSNLY